MDELKRAVKNALELYAETSGMTLQEVGKRFAESAACRENVYRTSSGARRLAASRWSDGLAGTVATETL